MPTPAIVPLEDVILSAATTSINISSIPNTYKDIIISLTWRNSGNGSAVRVRLNSSTGSHDWATFYGNMNASFGGWNGDENSSRAFGVAAGPTTEWQTGTITVYDYANPNRHTLLMARHADASGDSSWVGGRWESNAAVNTITIFDVLGQTIQSGARLQVWGRY